MKHSYSGAPALPAGEYVIIVEDVSEPPFFGERLEPAFLRVELQAPKRERRSTMKKPEEKKKQ